MATGQHALRGVAAGSRAGDCPGRQRRSGRHAAGIRVARGSFPDDQGELLDTDAVERGSCVLTRGDRVVGRTQASLQTQQRSLFHVGTPSVLPLHQPPQTSTNLEFLMRPILALAFLLVAAVSAFTYRDILL